MSFIQLLKMGSFMTATALAGAGVAAGSSVDTDKQELPEVNGKRIESVTPEEAGKPAEMQKNGVQEEENKSSALDVLSTSGNEPGDLKKDEKPISAPDEQSKSEKQPEALKKIEAKKEAPEAEKPTSAPEAVPTKQLESPQKIETKDKAPKVEKLVDSGKKAEMQPIVENKQTPAKVIGSASINNESPENLVILAEKNYNGIGVEKNVKKALKLFKEATKKGSGYACRRLGLEYSDFSFNDETPRDDKEARDWFEKAVKLGDVESMFYLSDFVFNGRGGKKDKKRATQLLLDAARNGCQNAAHRALKLNKKTGQLGQGSKESFVTLTAKDKEDFYRLDKQLRDSVTLQGY